MVSGKHEFPRRLDRVLSVGAGCAWAFFVFTFLPGLVVWAVTGNAELGRRLVRFLAGWGFGPAAVAYGLLWFALPYWGRFSNLVPSWEMRWSAVGMGACFWGVGIGLSVCALGGSALLAARVGLGVGFVGLLAGWLVTRRLDQLVLAGQDQEPSGAG